MTRRGFLALTVGLVLLLPAAAGAQGGKPTYQVSGGGQTVVSSDMTGAGSTIAFVAQGQGEDGDENARGQLQINDRLGDQGKFHGVVDCIIPDFAFDADGDTVEGVRFGGHVRQTGERFLVDVVDNGQPTPASDMDLVNFRKGSFSGCTDDSDEAPEMMLGRGNVTIHDRR